MWSDCVVYTEHYTYGQLIGNFAYAVCIVDHIAHICLATLIFDKNMNNYVTQNNMLTQTGFWYVIPHIEYSWLHGCGTVTT